MVCLIHFNVEELVLGYYKYINKLCININSNVSESTVTIQMGIETL